MSGGTFEHQEHHMRDIAEEIERVISTNDSKEIGEFGSTIGHNFPEKVLSKLKITRDTILKAYEMAHAVDYLLAGDTGEESFLEQWERRVEEIGH